MNYEDVSDFEISKEVAFAIRGRDAVCVIDTPLDKLVRIFNGNPKNEDGSGWVDFDPCNNPSDAWPIIVDNELSLWKTLDDWDASSNSGNIQHADKSPLRAAMICFLKMKDAEK